MNLKCLKSKLLIIAALFLFSMTHAVYATGNGEYRVDFGVVDPNAFYGSTLTTVPGWNNVIFSVPATTTIPLVDSNNASTSVGFAFTNPPACLDGSIRLNRIATQQNGAGYPESVSIDYFVDGINHWRCGAGNYGDGISTVLLTNLNPAWTYTVKVFSGYVNGPINLRMTIGSQSVTQNQTGNINISTVQIDNATTTATSSMAITFSDISPNGAGYYVGALEVIANTGNAAPVVDAGVDETFSSTTTSVTLSGTATDSDGSVATTTWMLFSGPTATITSSSSLTTTVTGMVPGKYVYRLYATDNFGKKVFDEKIVTISPYTFPASRPAKKIVVIGSSTTFGWGALNFENVYPGLYKNGVSGLFEEYMRLYNASSSVVNFGVAGYTISRALPTGTGLGEDTAKNITAALAQNPDGILLNFTTNDAFSSVPVATSLGYLQTIVNTASAANVPVWITTSAGRSNLDVTRQNLLIAYRDAVMQQFATSTLTNGGRAVNIWDPVSTSAGLINATFNSGDNVHLNNAGHSELYKDLIQSNIMTTLYATVPGTLVASGSVSGTDATLTWSAPADEGGLMMTQYSIYNADTNVLIATTTSTTTTYAIPGLVKGNTYSYYITSTNLVGQSASSTAVVLNVPLDPVSAAPLWSPGSSYGTGSVPASLLPFVTNTNTPTVTAPFASGITSASFTRSLAQGAKGNDVKTLQQYLNSKGFLVALTGLGSKGKETNLFGPATKAALIRFQKAMKIAPAVGFFGPVTRAAIK